MKTDKGSSRLGMELLRSIIRTAAVLPVIVLISYVVIFWDVRQNIARLSNDMGFEWDLDQLQKALTDQETGQRGYLMTGYPSFLDPYVSGSLEYREAGSRLRNRIADPTTLEAVNRIIEAGQAWHDQFAEGQIRLFQSGVKVTQQQMLAAKQASDSFRAQYQALQTLVSSQEEKLRVRLTKDIVLVASSFFILSGILFVLLIIRIRNQLYRRIYPLKQLSSIVSEYAEGRFDRPALETPEPEPNEIGRLTQSIEIMRRELRERFQWNEELADWIGRMKDFSEEEDLYGKMLEALARKLGCDFASVVLRTGTDRFYVAARLEGDEVRVAHEMIGEEQISSLDAAQGNQLLLYPDWERERPHGTLDEVLYVKGVRSSVHMPIMLRNRCIALMNFGSCTPGQYSQREVNLAKPLLPLIGFAMAALETERKYTAVVRSASDGIVLANQQLEILEWNDGAAQLFGFSRQEAIGQPVELFIPDWTEEGYRNRLQKLMKDEGSGVFGRPIELVGRRKDGNELTIEMTLDRWNSGGQLYFNGIFRDITMRKEAERKLEEANETFARLSTLDGLTGIPNRRLFDETFYLEWRKAIRSRRALAVILCDVDCFKAFNDFYGHLKGDSCLKKVAATLHAQARRPGDLAARFGGEEFIVLLPETDRDGAVLVAEQMRAAVEELRIRHERSTAGAWVTVSVGVASLVPEAFLDPHQLLESADRALYEAKGSGRNQVRLFME